MTSFVRSLSPTLRGEEMRVVGLTGSIGMGKSTTAKMFMRRGVPVHDSDAAVHRLYSGAAVVPIEAAFPGVVENGVVDRSRLAERVVGDREALLQLEAIVHPLVRESENAFLARMKAETRRLVVVDVPLLFETQATHRVDAIVVVTADAEVQRARVMARPGMTEERFAGLLARQVADAEKRRGAHFLVDSGRGMEPADRAVAAILAALAFTL
jgi:dephospho-CoA kinase